FSSRRRHTRSKRDWSSDVCSSDLLESVPSLRGPESVESLLSFRVPESFWLSLSRRDPLSGWLPLSRRPLGVLSRESERLEGPSRSEERRVGKGGGAGGGGGRRGRG